MTFLADSVFSDLLSEEKNKAFVADGEKSTQMYHFAHIESQLMKTYVYLNYPQHILANNIDSLENHRKTMP